MTDPKPARSTTALAALYEDEDTPLAGTAPAKPPTETEPSVTAALDNPTTSYDGTRTFQVLVRETVPDPTQARWLLPTAIRDRFLARKIDALQAMRDWQKYVEGMAKRAEKSGKSTEEIDAIPEVSELREIESLARSIQSGGQVQPITVVRQGKRWVIEVGERRYWSHVQLLVAGDRSADRILALQRLAIDPFRQAYENRQRRDLGAIATAREIARLMEAATESAMWQKSSPPSLADYRAAAQRRVSAEVIERISEALSMSANYVGRYRQLLSLPDEALLVADRANLTEGQLRPILDVKPAKQQVEIVKAVAELGLAGSKVDWLCKQRDVAAALRKLHEQSAADAQKAKPAAKQSVQAQALYSKSVGLGRTAARLAEQGAEPAKVLAREYVAAHGTQAVKELQKLGVLFREAAGEAQKSAGKQKKAKG